MGCGGGLRTSRRTGAYIFPHSLGIFYQALTQYLGFPHYGDEYKVMGLAPYGRPSFLDAMRKIVRLLPDGGFELDLRFFRHHREDIAYQWAEGSPEFGDLFSPALEQLLGPRRQPADPLEDRHRDIARSAQAMYEEAFFHLLERIAEALRIDRPRAGGRLCHELCGQRQGAADDAVPTRLRPGGGRRCGRRHWRGFCRLAQARREAHLRDGPRILGAGFRCGGNRASS